MTDRDAQETRRVISEWVNELADELGAAEATVDIDEILAVAGVAAHAVLRPAAPVTTYLLGYVAGRAARGQNVAGHIASPTDGATAVSSAAAFTEAAAGVRRAAGKRRSSPTE